MTQLDRLWTEVQPLISRLSHEEQEKITTAFENVRLSESPPTTKKPHLQMDQGNLSPVSPAAHDELRQRYQTLFENSGTAMIVIGNDGMISLANTLFQELLGYRREDVEGRKKYFEFFTEQSHTQILDYHNRRRAGDKTVPHRYEAQIIRSDGEILDVIIMIGLFLGTTDSVVSIVDNTEQKRTADELRLFRTSVDRAKDGIFWFDFEGNYLYLNETASLNIGYSLEDLKGRKIYELIRDVTEAKWHRFILTLRKKGSVRIETRRRQRNGEMKEIEIVANYVRRDKREYALAFVRDITERKRVDEELLLLKISVDRGYDEVFWMDMDANMLYANEAACRTTGYSPEELHAMKIYELDPDFNPGSWEKSIEDLRKNKKQSFTTHHRCKDGRILDVAINSVYVTKDDKEYAFCFVHDITESKRAETELSAAHEQLIATEQELRRQFEMLAASQKLLEESEAKFHGVFNNANDGIFMHSLTDRGPGKFLEVNDSMCKALGYTREEFLAMTVTDILSEEQRRKMPEIGKAIAQQGNITFESEYQRKDGTTAPVEVNSRVYQLSGKMVVLSIARDIAERKRAEQILIRKNDELEAAYEQMAAVEQELRTNYENLRETETKLRESEAWMREFTELLPQFVYEIDTAGRLLFVNQYAEEVFGITKDLLLQGVHIHDLIIPDDWEKVATNQTRILDGRKSTYEVYRLRKKDGTVIPTNIYTAPVYQDGTLRGFRGIVVDISELLSVQENLQKSEGRFRELAELLPQIVFELDEKLEFTFFNWNTVQMTGYSYQDLSQGRKSVFTILQKTDQQQVEQFFSGILKSGTGGHIGCTMITELQREIPAIIYASPIITENRIAGIRGVIVDISEEKELETALRESETRFRELAELFPQFIFETDRNFRFSYFNLSAMTMTGYSYDEFSRGLDAFSLVEITDRPRLRESFQNILGGQNIPPLQIPLKKKGGELLPVILYASPIVRGNDYDGVRGIIVDIADQKRLETALATTNQKLNLMNSLTRHDVLNNITGLLGLVDMMGELAKEHDALVMLSEIRGLIITIKDQIIFTRDYQDVGVKSPQWQSLCQSIQYASSTTALDRVVLKMPSVDYRIYADPFFGRVFYNLIDNSIRHGGSVRDILVDTEQAGDGSLIIRYHDDGIGVPPDEKEMIFKQGYGKHTGFGLFIIREILAITGMTIRETGTFRSGVLFEITVPKESWQPSSGNGAKERSTADMQESGQENIR